MDASRNSDLVEQRRRLAASLSLAHPADLPISEHADEIRRLVRNHQVVVVAGETGSGKTTQLAKMCVAEGLGIDRPIAHTQPRRLAARTVARRIAEEMGTEIGDAVGYAVRFDDKVAPQSLISLVTDGLLLTETRRDRWLNRYDAVIVDEAHERSLNIDFLLGVLKRALAKRPEFRVIVTSATIDVQRFADYFGGAPVVEVSGRSFPVAVKYAEDLVVERDADADDLLIGALEDIATTPRTHRAQDVLVFQTGEREIFESARTIRDRFGEQFEVLPLYARLRASEQAKVFTPGRRQRVVLATNVAETSLTVPNIGYVVDPGYARLNRYSYRTKLQRLPVEPISQASAQQRAGRCGRVAPGVCYRLYSESDFAGREAFTDPEIRRVNLASVMLQMRAFALGEISRFGFIDPPEHRAVRDAERLLIELGALSDNKLTKVGRAMARLPVDPRLGRMLVAGAAAGALDELITVTSALAVQDPRERPLAQQSAADAKHERFVDERGDFMTLLNLWSWLKSLRANSTRSQERKAHVAHFINPARVREWRDLHRQLVVVARQLGWKLNQVPAKPEEVHNAVLAGCLSLIGVHDEKGLYLGARGSKFRIFPGSSLHGQTPKWVAAADIAETAKVYARTVCAVQPRWIEAHAGHLLKRQHSEPHWSAKRGEACVYERVTLYGLTLADKRVAPLARHDAALARELFIREGFMQGAVGDKARRAAPCFDAFASAKTAVLELEARGRQRNLLLAEDEIHALIDDRLAAGVCDVSSFIRWWKRAGPDDRQALMFDQQMLQAHRVARLDDPALFPNSLDSGDMKFKLAYRFAPGAPDDGVNLVVPFGLLQGVAPESLEWGVLGFLPLVVEGWLRSLSKTQRRKLAPIADRVEPLVDFLSAEERFRVGRFSAALSMGTRALFDLEVAEIDWHPERLSDNLKLNVQVVGRKGKLLAQGRDLAALQKRFQPEAPVVEAAEDRQPITEFPRQGLAVKRTVKQAHGPALVYPALFDDQGSVLLRDAGTPSQAALWNRAGYTRLTLMKLGSAARYFRKQIDKNQKLGLYFSSLGDASQLRDELLKGAIWICYFEGEELPRSAAEFDARLAARRGDLATVFGELLDKFEQILEARFQLARTLDGATSPAYEDAVRNAREVMAELVPGDVLSRYPSGFLYEISQFLQAQRYRIENLQGKVARDAEHVRTIAGLAERLNKVADHRLTLPGECADLALQLERVRVALFAEPLAKKGQGSVKKLTKALEDVERRIGLL